MCHGLLDDFYFFPISGPRKPKVAFSLSSCRPGHGEWDRVCLLPWLECWDVKRGGKQQKKYSIWRRSAVVEVFGERAVGSYRFALRSHMSGFWKKP